ncbi:MAG TPA: Rid family detoxifying hydrolase [Candidatus Limnocylindrales bacterium]|jgi:2-iminobutanoate/2-iminopropanoate deaminase|nr:Rid family detoxifying hydrolase [Candidatus Limnocylindrales bacterium]
MTTRDVIRTDAAPEAAGPYSQAIRAGDLVFTAGQLGTDPTTGAFAGDDVAAQAERALANLAAILEAAGSGLDRLVKVTVFLADIGDWPAVNEVYARVVPEPFPARSAFAVRDLPKGARVEIEAVAVSGLG